MWNDPGPVTVTAVQCALHEAEAHCCTFSGSNEAEGVDVAVTNIQYVCV
jgi:hypothetical protein